QAGGLEFAHRPAIAVREDCFRAVGRAGNLGKPAGDGVDGLVPGDALESSFPFLTDPRHRVEEAIRAVDPLQVSGHLLAEESSPEGMIRVAPQFHGHSVADRDEHAARVRAIERADILDLRRHRSLSSVPRGAPGPRPSGKEYSR